MSKARSAPLLPSWARLRSRKLDPGRGDSASAGARCPGPNPDPVSRGGLLSAHRPVLGPPSAAWLSSSSAPSTVGSSKPDMDGLRHTMHSDFSCSAPLMQRAGKGHINSEPVAISEG